FPNRHSFRPLARHRPKGPVSYENPGRTRGDEFPNWDGEAPAEPSLLPITAPSARIRGLRSRWKCDHGIGMRYELQYKPQAQRDLGRLAPDVLRRIIKKLETLRNDLAGDIKRLVQHEPDLR